MTLAEQLAQAIANLETANASVTNLTAQVGTLTGERDTATARVTTLEGQVTALTGERDTHAASIKTLNASVTALTTERDALKANQATAEEIARRTMAGTGQPAPVTADTTGGKKDPAKMTLTERCQAAVAAAQGKAK